MQEVTAEELDRMFDEGEDMTPFIRMDTIRRVGRQDGRKRVSIDMAGEALDRLDAYAEEYDVPRQALVKMWLMERMNEEDDRKAARGKTVA